MTVGNAKIFKGVSLSDIAVISTRTKTPEGCLDVKAAISRSGIYLYSADELGITNAEPGQVIRVLRTDNEVFNEQSMGSFTKKPVTDGHPPAMVDAGNSRQFKVGQSGEAAVRDGDSVSMGLFIDDKSAVEKVEAGTVELSCGYTADITIEAGNDPIHGAFDAVQKNIRGNHIAIVDKGRAGNTCKIKDKKLQDSKGATMLTVLVDGYSIETTELGKQAIDKLVVQLSDATAKIATDSELNKAAIETMTADHKAAVAKLTGELEGVKSQIPGAEQLDAMVAERTSIIDAAIKMVKDFKPEGMSNLDIKKVVIVTKTDQTDETMAAADDIFVDGLFAGVTAAFTKGDDNLRLVKDLKPGEKATSIPGNEVNDARDAHMKRSQEAYKTKLAV